MSFKVFDEHTIEENRQMTSDYLLEGLLMTSKNEPESNTYKLLTGLSKELKVLEEQINNCANEGYAQEFSDTTLSRWEKDLGIPDDIFQNTGTLEERKTNVLIKIASLGVQTASEFIALAKLLGYNSIQILAGGDIMIFPLEFPFIFSPSTKSAKHTIIVDLPADLNNVVFPITFPLEYSSDPLGYLEKLFNQLKPANCIVLFRYVL